LATPNQALAHNGRLKLAALGLSVFLWVLVQTEPSNQETFASVPVLVQVADTSWTPSGAPNPSVVEVRLGGPAREIIRLAREGASLRVPIGAVGSQDTLVALRREWVELGQRSRVTVESLTPSSIRISFEEAETRLVPVAPRLIGRVPDQLALASPIEVSPQMVRIRGPRSRVEGLDSLRLGAFDLSDLSRSGTFLVRLDTTGLLGSSVVPASATLGVQVEDRIERVLDGIPVELDSGSDELGVLAYPPTLQVRLTGARTLVRSVDPQRLRAWVPSGDLDGMAPGEERIVFIRLDGFPGLVTAVSDTDRVTVRRRTDAPSPSAGTER